MTSDNKSVPDAVAVESDTAIARKSSRGILCAKCEHVNSAGSTKCSRCGSHLHIKCHDCGVVNERTISTCKSCGRRLHKNVFQKMTARVGGGGVARVKPMHIALFVVVVTVITYVVISLTQIQLPQNP
jgi:hypothetical protein